MTELDDSGPRAELEREALSRMRRLVSGEATIADIEEAKRWRSQSSDHAEAFAFARQLWDRLGPAGRNVLERRGEDLLSDHVALVSRRLTRRAALGCAVAASAAAYAIVRPPFELWPSFSELAADYRTATGEQRQIALADGASVKLNTQTSVALRHSTDGNDRLELINGEAAVTTGRRLTKPLVVIAGDGRISSQDASFNVRYDSHASCVTCVEGVVRVERQDAALMLEARQQATYAAHGLDAPAAIDPAVVTTWQEGLLVFHRAPLSEVVAEINRYRPGRVVLLNADLGRRPIDARFHVGNVDEIMSLVHEVLGARVISLPGRLVLVG